MLPILRLNNKDVADYSQKNSYAQMMFIGGAEDYVSARCLILNGLFTGFFLYSQAIEKFLKALIFLETGKEPELDRSNWHDPYKLKLELQKHKDYSLDRFDEVLQRLHGHFQTRYFDNNNQSKMMSGKELDEFDELWMHLFDLVPFPIEVKYRLEFPVQILSKRAVKYWPGVRHWATLDNKSLPPDKINRMEEIYFAVKQHLYGDRIQRMDQGTGS